MYKHVFRTLAQFASLAVVMTTIAAAQGLQTGEIAGRVSSQDGLSLPGVTVTVRNSGARAGDEVVQLYLRPLDPRRPRALKDLRGVERITLKPGESRAVTFTVVPSRDLVVYDDVRKQYVVEPGRFELQIGTSSADIRARSVFSVAE